MRLVSTNRRFIRCPHCENIVAEAHGPLITCEVAVRGRNRRKISFSGDARFVCDKCGHGWEYHAQNTDATETQDTETQSFSRSLAGAF